MILNIVRDARHFIGEVSSPFAKRESACVCVCDDVWHTRIHTAPVYGIVASAVGASITHRYIPGEGEEIHGCDACLRHRVQYDTSGGFFG